MQPRAQDLEEDENGFELLCKKLYELSGIHLPKNQKNISLMSGRMIKVLHKMNLNNYNQFYKLLRANDEQAKKDFIEALTTHTTHFFRESIHFSTLTQLISENFINCPELRIWCGACSTGEEAYSLAMTLAELKFPNLKFKILATDIDKKVVDIANHGVYNSKNMSNISSDLLKKYFIKGNGDFKELYKVKNTIRDHLFFSTFNLIQDNYSFKNNFHIIFLRNVLIYFDKETISKIIKKMSIFLDNNSYLFVGLSEAGVSTLNRFTKISPGVLKRTLTNQEVDL